MVEDKEILEELKRIRIALETKPTPPPPKGLWNEFIDFLSKYRVMGLAIAFIMGLYLGGLVQALVADFIIPVIGLAVPGLGNLATEEFLVGSQHFAYGHFLVALITFIIVALVIFLIVKIAKRWHIE